MQYIHAKTLTRNIYTNTYNISNELLMKNAPILIMIDGNFRANFSHLFIEFFLRI